MYKRALAASLVLTVSLTPFFNGVEARQDDQDVAVEEAQIAPQKTPERQHADYYHVLFTYLQNDYLTTLGLIDKGFTVHGFNALSEEDFDRLTLMQGASQLYLGLYEKSQSIFLSLLDRATSDYVIAQTWYWLAKSGFENKQQFRSEQAYQAILSQELEEYLTFEQWQELTYLAAHGRMLAQSNWQPLFEELHRSTIFPAYLQANHAVSLFNQAQFDEAETYFVNAKQSLITHQQAQNSVFRVAREFTSDFIYYLSPWNWFSDDPNRLAQQAQENQAQEALQKEQNALFDQINLFLGYALLQQQDDKNAMEVIKQVSSEDIQAKEALLTLGWAYAQENEWLDAMQTWQYLSENDVGHFQLQAGYAMAYAFQQQGEFGQAYFALDNTVGQIESSIAVLNDFSGAILEENFLDNYDDVWPMQLHDIKRIFLTSAFEANYIDTNYYLSVRNQSKEILATLQNREQQVAVLESMLQQRESSFEQRGQSLALGDPQAKLDDAKQRIEELKQQLTYNGPEQKQELMIRMLSDRDLQDWSRLQRALERHERLLKDPPRGRPLRPSYAERLNRIKGIMQWKMEDSFITENWRHKRLLQGAEQAFELANKGLQSVIDAQSRSPELERDRKRIEALKDQMADHKQKAQTVFQRADRMLITYLSGIVEARKVELEKQWVNARLARIRLQDMQPDEGTEESPDSLPQTQQTNTTQPAEPVQQGGDAW